MNNQKLFDVLYETFDISATQGEMDEIIRAVEEDNNRKRIYLLDEIGQADIRPSDNYKKELLEKYSMWLTKNGYMGTDWKDEEPFAIDEFLKTLK